MTTTNSAHTQSILIFLLIWSFIYLDIFWTSKSFVIISRKHFVLMCVSQQLLVHLQFYVSTVSLF